MKNKPVLTVYYDGLCKVCSKEIEHYKVQKGADRISFIDICGNSFDPEKEGLDPLEVHKVMHVRRFDGSLAIRVEAFIEIWQVLPKYNFLAKLAKMSLVRGGLELGYTIFTKLRPYLPRYESSKADCTDSPYCETKNV